MQVHERVDVRLLHHVLDVPLVAQHRAHDSVNPLVVPAHEDLEERSLATHHPFGNLAVGKRCGRFQRCRGQLGGFHIH